ncbi:MAG TPA: class II fructose-bisphosphate aldolase [Candidatus Paceibacterota bacterium]|jgi:fructose-bisphosphate aldolase class II|nr:class II fructose-bisphosphate aldolase [Candidatus Paceibacterota bacterium]
MNTLKEYLAQARAEKRAIGHFNFSNIEGLYAIARAAKALNVPVLVGTAEGEEEAVGTDAAVALVKIIREKWNIPIFLNADHHYSFETVKKCIDAGYDSVIYDGADKSFEENIAISKQCVEYARQVSAQTGRDILVEVELGFIGQGSQLRDAIPEGIAAVTSPEEAKSFLEQTGADALAPAVGNFHGMLKQGTKPRLNIDCIKSIAAITDKPLVLHGGSGEEADFAAAIDAGISVIHVNTELRRAFTDALRSYLNEHPDDIAPYKYTAGASLAMEKAVTEKLKIFNRMV